MEVRGREEDTTVLFTRFLKLLLNDANFLLDEALRNLSEVHHVFVYFYSLIYPTLLRVEVEYMFNYILLNLTDQEDRGFAR